MSDLNVKLSLQEDLTKKFSQISSSGKSVEKELKSLGKTIDSAFRDLGKSADSATREASQLGEAIQDIDSGGLDDFGWMDDFSKQIKEATSGLDKLSRKMDDLDSGFDLGGSSSDLGNFADKADEAGESLRQMDSQAGSLTGTIKGLVAAVASYVALDTIKDFGLDTLETAANQQAMTSQFGQVFGDLEGTASSSLGQIADDTGILENRLKSSYTQIAAFAKTTGMDTADALELSNRAMVAVADSAAFYDRSLEEVTESLQSYLKGNYENDAALGLSSTEYTRNAAAMELYNKEFQDLTESQKQLTLLQMVEDANELSGAMGQAARESETWSNQTGNLAQAWTDLKAELGDEILDESVEGIGVLIDNMDTIKEPLVDLFSTVGDVMQDLIPLIPGALKTLTSGLKALGNVIGPLFDGVRENPELVGDAIASIGSAALTYKAATNLPNVVSGISNLWGVLSNHPWAIGATAVVGAIGAIGTAVEHYNEMQMENNLEEHFGDLELTSEQAQEFARQIIPVGITAQLELANVSFDESDTLVSEAEDLLAQNDYINWKVNSIGLDMTETDASSLLQNTETFVSTVEDALEKEQYSAELAVKALLGDVESTELISEMQSWFKEDMGTVESLGNAVTDLLQRSIDEGTYNINTQTAIEIMQAKMLDIVNGAKQAELQGQLDWLEINSSGAALTPESWTEVVGYLDEYRQSSKEADAEAYTGLLGYFRQAEYNGHITESQMDDIMDVIKTAVDQQDSYALASSWEFLNNSMGEAYGEELSALQEAMDSSNFRDKIIGADGQSGLTFAQADLESYMNDAFKGLDSGTRDALADRYQTMLPTVQEMDAIIAEAAETGKAVPEALMESYRDAMAMGAASGDSEAMWQYMANEVAQDFPSMEELISTMEANGLDFSQFPEEIQNSFEKAFVETDPSIDFSGMLTDLVNSASENDEFDWSEINSILEGYGLSISNALKDQGVDIEGEVPLNTDNLHIDIEELARNLEGLTATGLTSAGNVEYTVESGDTLWNYAAQLTEETSQIPNIIDQIMELNPELTNPNEIQTGSILILPGDLVLDESAAAELGKEADEELKESVGEDPVETEKPVDITYTEGEKDTSQLDDSLPETLPGEEETASREIPTDITFEVASLDDSALASGVEGLLGEQEPIPIDVPVAINAIQESFSADEALASAAESLTAAFVTPLPADGYADVLINKASDNIASLYSQIGAELQSAFDSTYSVTAQAMIHVNYSLANPTASLSFSGGGTGETTVSAALHAAGGYFDEPHLGMVAEAGPEYIIPIDGSDRSRDMLYDAGEMLGMDMRDDSIAAPQVWGGESGEYTETRNDSRTVNININGNGRISVPSGVSREEVVDILMEQFRDTLLQIVQEEIIERGDSEYEY